MNPGYRIAVLDLVASVAAILMFFTTNPWVSIALWVITLASVAYSTEITIALYNVRIWYNVIVVSALAALPQAISAIELALGGHVTAAWVDTIMSTVVDAIFVTALVRPYAPGSPYIKRLLPSLILWSMAALAVDLYAHTGVRSTAVTSVFAVLGYLALPILITLNIGGGGPWERPPAKVIATALVNTVAMSIATWYLIESVYQLQLAELQLGLTSTFLTALPDLIAALMIRAIFAAVEGSEASEAEAVATMLAAAVHDQVSVPALILLMVPGAGSLYPTLLNLFAVAVKFTLLNRKAYYLIGLPASLAIVLLLL